ncbi:MAG: DUF1565 domain-containing protein [Planctomycetota bacterium]|jgi:hypothetical protein
MRKQIILAAACMAVMYSAQTAASREIHVSKAGRNSDAGDRDNPYLTIGKAAQVAAPGDTVIVHAGTYREWVRPARSGTSEGKRIT